MLNYLTVLVHTKTIIHLIDRKKTSENATHVEVYQKQIEDIVDREVARKLTLKE